MIAGNGWALKSISNEREQRNLLSLTPPPRSWAVEELVLCEEVNDIFPTKALPVHYFYLSCMLVSRVRHSCRFGATFDSDLRTRVSEDVVLLCCSDSIFFHRSSYAWTLVYIPPFDHAYRTSLCFCP